VPDLRGQVPADLHKKASYGLCLSRTPAGDADQVFGSFRKKIHRRFTDFEAALQFLTGLRYKQGSGSFDARDHLVKAKPLAFNKLAADWLAVKAKTIKPESLKPLRLAMERACKAWGAANINGIGYAEVEDLINSLDRLAPKSRKHTLDALKQFWQWAADRLDIPAMKKWPRLGFVEMAFRETVDIPTQQAIINDIRKHEPVRVWLCIHLLANYIAIRPGEMCALNEGQVDIQRGFLIVPHPKEKYSKIIPMTRDDIAMIEGLNLRPALNLTAPFFRHEGGAYDGKGFGHDLLYRAWKRACGRLGIQGVPLYPGTKHSTAMGLRAIQTPEQIQAQTLHRTGAAFRRYFQTAGEDLRKLLEGRKTLLTPGGGELPPDNGQVLKFEPGNRLVTDFRVFSEGKILKFKSKGGGGGGGV
jgi:integrase